MEDLLGSRMKMYEKVECGRRFVPLLPVVARIDGKAFHSFTKGFSKPFDFNFMGVMWQTTEKLVEVTNAKIGYTQSDEISLVFYSDSVDSQIFFDGKIFKMNSVLASMATAYFNDFYQEMVHCLQHEAPIEKFNIYGNKPPALFDCRTWQLPTKQEVANYLIWREQDAVRNSIQSVGQAHFSPKQLHGKSCDEIQEMLFQEHEINWNDCSPMEKRGVYFSRQVSKRKFTIEELEKLPPKHEARRNPDLEVVRRDVKELDLPRLTQVTNLIDVIFEGVPYES